MNIEEKIAITLMGIAMTATIIWAANIGMNKQERNECRQWQAEAKEYLGYYLLGWQKEQCDHWGIPIDIKVVK
jgi:hypothetical protein